MRRWAAPMCLALCALALGAARSAEGSTPPLKGFLSMPTDQIAVPGLAGSAELTPEGDLYTGWAEYRVRFGRRLQEWDQPTRTLPNPAVPSYVATLSDGPVRYSETVFAVPVAGKPVAYETIVAANHSNRPQRAQVEMSIAYTHGSLIHSPDGGYTTPFRFQRPALGGSLGSYFQLGQLYSGSFAYSFAGRDIDRSGLLLARGPAAPSRAVRLPVEITPTAPHEARIFRLALPRHGQASLTWQVPLDPPPAAAATDQALDQIAPKQAGAELRGFWATEEAGMMKLSVPEPKVIATYQAAIAEILDSRLLTGAGWEQMPNRLQYEAFWIRDAAIETQALDLAGLHVPAAQNLEFIDSFQDRNGLFISQPEQYDELGQALWAIGQHAALTQDPDYATGQLPRMQAAIDWLALATESDPLGLLPVADPGDNELAAGHITGDDLWAAVGLRAAIATARLAGREDLAASWQSLDERFESSLDTAVEAAFAREGHIPPVLDVGGGQDWGNYWAAFPAQLLSPTAPAVQATVAWANAHMVQGLPTYKDGSSLHDYLGFRIFETELEAGDPGAALGGLYAELDHTTSTDAGWETVPAPFHQRTSSTNLAPHGTFAAEYVALLRNMLIREGPGGEVTLLSGASPAWLGPGQHIAVTSAPTAHGEISFTERSTPAGETLAWQDDFPPGTQLQWALPWWATGARLTGGTIVGADVALQGDTGTLSVSFGGTRPDESYAQAVGALNAEYEAAGHPPPLVPAAGQL